MNRLRTFGTSSVLHSTQQSCSCEGQRADGFLLLQPGLNGFQAEKPISSPRLVLALECITHPEGVQSFLEGFVFLYLNNSEALVCSPPEVWGQAHKKIYPGMTLHFCFPEAEM